MTVNSKSGARPRALSFAGCLLLAVVCAEARLSAQVDGHVSVVADAVPNVGEGVQEMRGRLFAEWRQQVGSHIRLNVAGHVDALLADRGQPGLSRDAVIRPDDVYADLVWDKFDVRVGAARLVWGRLDEFPPTDVINPIDVSRLLLEGRSEARLAVGLVRTRAFLPGASTIEAVVVPAFRRGLFDQLEEETSPFSLLPPVRQEEPALTWGNVQGGARFTSTIGRVDYGVSAYRGFRPFPRIQVPAFSPTEPVAIYPRYTMVGADFETVRGAWGLRGEIASFEDAGRSFEGGLGVDRRAGDYRVASNVFVAHNAGDTNVMLVAAVDRNFARQTRTLRMFGVYAPTEQTGFVRAIGAVSVHENMWLEGSAGVFAGTSQELLGRLTDRDFLSFRLKVYF